MFVAARFKSPVVTGVSLYRGNTSAALLDCSLFSADGRPVGVQAGAFARMVVSGTDLGDGSATRVTVFGVPCPLVPGSVTHDRLMCDTTLCIGKV